MAAQSEPLALTSQAHDDQKGRRRNQQFIDALPYVDEITPEERQVVDRLIHEELRSSRKRPENYLEEVPPIPASTLSSLLTGELARIERGEAFQSIDTARYDLVAPVADDLDSWRSALENAHAQLEHQRNRLINLELLQKYGADSWRAANETLTSCVNQLLADVAALKADSERVNRERKLLQTAAGREIKTLEREYMRLVLKNREIEEAINALQSC